MHDPPAYVWAITIAGPPRSRLRPASCCTAARNAQAWAEGARRCSPGPRPSCSAAGSPPPRSSRVTAGTTGRSATGAVAAGRGGRVAGHAAGAQPHPGGDARPGGAGHGEPPRAAALVPGGQGWSSCCTWPSVICPRCSRCPRASATSPPVSPRRWSGEGSRRAPAPRRPVVQHVRHDQSGGGPDPRRPHRIRAAHCHAVGCADQRAPARVIPTAVVPLLSPCTSRPCPCWLRAQRTAASHRPPIVDATPAARRKPGPTPVKYST